MKRRDWLAWPKPKEQHVMLKKIAQFCTRAVLVFLVIAVGVGIFAATVGLAVKVHQSVHNGAR